MATRSVHLSAGFTTASKRLRRHEAIEEVVTHCGPNGTLRVYSNPQAGSGHVHGGRETMRAMTLDRCQFVFLPRLNTADSATRSVFGALDVVMHLQVQPALHVSLKKPCQPQRRIHADAAPLPHDLIRCVQASRPAHAQARC